MTTPTSSLNNTKNKPQNSTNAVGLSEQDVALLLSEKSSGARQQVVGKIAKSYTGESFGAKEKEVAEQIFRMLMKDTEVAVRASMAEALKDSDSVPRDIVMQMANDVEQVALPVLQSSQSLSEYDLIQVIEKKGELSRLLAIAQRQNVPERVSGALVDTGQQAVVSVLVQNDGAKISEKSMAAIIEEYQDQNDIMAGMVARQELPAGIALRMVSLVSDELAAQLRARTQLSIEQAHQQAEQAREAVTLKIIKDSAPAETPAQEMVDELAEENKLSPSIILGALCRGNLPFFEMALAKLAGIPLKNAKILIHDKSGLGFAKLYEKTGLPDSMKDATRITMQVIKTLLEEDKKPGTTHFANEAVGHILRLSKGQEVDNLSYIIALIRQHATK